MIIMGADFKGQVIAADLRHLMDKNRIAELITKDRNRILNIFRLYEYKNRIRFEKSINCLLSVMNMIKNYPGRKPVLLISSGFPSLSLEKYFPGQIESTVGHSDLNAAKINDPFRVLGERKKRYGEDIFENLIQFANTHNITFYTMDPDSYLRYIFSDMTFDSFFKLSEPSDIKRDELFKLELISDDTGGTTLQGAKKYDQFQDLLRSDLHSYYELSYYPRRKKADGKYHKIEVKVKRPDIKIRFRQGYYDYTEEQEKSLVFASASSNPGLFKEISFQAKAVPFITNKDSYRLWINMALPVKDLILGGDPYKDFKILNANFWVNDEQGENAFHAQLNIPVNLSESQRKRLQEARFFGYNTSSNELKLKQDQYKIIFTIYDEDSDRVGTVEQTMTIPAFDELTKGEITCVVFGHKAEIRKKDRTISFSIEDGSLVVDNLRFYPMGTNQFNAQEDIYLFLQVYSDDDKVNLIPHFELMKMDVLQGSLEGAIIKESWNKKAKVKNMIVQLNFQGLDPGEYFLSIKMMDDNLVELTNRKIEVELF